MEHQFSFLLIFFLQTSLGSGEIFFYQKTSFFKVLVALSPLTLLWEFWKIHRSQPFSSSRLLFHPTSQYLSEYNLIRVLIIIKIPNLCWTIIKWFWLLEITLQFTYNKFSCINVNSILNSFFCDEIPNCWHF